ncbi:transcription initiation factor TFIID subunit 4-like isoform X2 [Limulus polyphemus]|uniref:Transcription initiation factor TFIID subunit 4-like isoform X2 n=1 Tax=Limulus polyphemus TaxID=6850 RepID=A0ABM1SVG1_LIMPO|nr:transcription initiation factor TFIID subunit 4-like isoform X2 [Limulus polyphemus]
MELKWVVPTASDMTHCTTRAQFSSCVSTTKMESAKTLDDMLLSEVDESAVTALVGSLESQLSSSSVQNPSRDTFASPIINNDINNTHNSASVRVQQRLQNGEKASTGRPTTESTGSDIASSLTLATYQQTHNQHSLENERTRTDSRTINNPADVNDTNIAHHSSIAVRAINSPGPGASSNSVMVTLTGALGLPASGYISQLQIPRPNANARSNVTTPQDTTCLSGGRINVNVRPAGSGPTVAIRPVSTGPGTIRPIAISNNSMKTVYSLHQIGAEYNSAINNSTNGVTTSCVRPASAIQPLAKPGTAVPNGSVGISGTNVGLSLNGNVIVSHSGQPVMPVITGTTVLGNSSSNSNVTASSSSAGAVFNLANLPVSLASQQPHVIIRSVPQGTPTTLSRQNTSEAKPSLTGVRPIVNEQQDQKQLKDGSVQKQMSGSTHLQNLTSNVIHINNSLGVPVQTVSKTISLQSQQPVTIVNQSVTNPTVLPGVQLANVTPARPSIGAMSQKTLAPRVVLSNPVRLAPSPQMITARPGGQGIQVAGQNTITLQPGAFMRGTLLVKTENGQFQVVNLAPGPVPNSAVTSATKTPSYRLQNVQPGTQLVRTLTPQDITAAIPVASSGATLKQTSTVPVTKTVLQYSTATSNVSCLPQHTTTMVVSTSIPTITQPLTVQTSNINTQAASTTSQMSPSTAKKKCKNFLSTLIQLAKDQPEHVATNVKNLIQGLINGQVQPEDFTQQLQAELNSSPQPCLVPFLKKSLPHLRHSLMTGESSIDGIRPPPATAFILPSTTATIARNQVMNKTLVNQPSAQIRVVTQGPLSTQLTQPAGIIQKRLSTDAGARVKSLLVSTNLNKPSGSPVVLSTATVQSKAGSQARNLPKDKKAVAAVSQEDDDFNDVAAMGGVNLVEESQRILASNSEMVGTEIRSCKDSNFLFTGPLERRIKQIAAHHGLNEVSPDVVALVSHGTEERIKNLVERLGIIAEHRLENVKNDPRYEVTQDVRSQLKYLEELDRLEKKRHEEQEREILMKAAKSRSKVEDPDKMKLKLKAKELQRAELEEMRQREANMTALLAIGPRKKQKLDTAKTGLNSVRPRVKRVNLRDLLFFMENEKDMARGTLLYKMYLK